MPAPSRLQVPIKLHDPLGIDRFAIEQHHLIVFLIMKVGDVRLGNHAVIHHPRTSARPLGWSSLALQLIRWLHVVDLAHQCSAYQHSLRPHTIAAEFLATLLVPDAAISRARVLQRLAPMIRQIDAGPIQALAIGDALIETGIRDHRHVLGGQAMPQEYLVRLVVEDHLRNIDVSLRDPRHRAAVLLRQLCTTSGEALPMDFVLNSADFQYPNVRRQAVLQALLTGRRLDHLHDLLLQVLGPVPLVCASARPIRRRL
mmetsp:Transcript_100979/g.324201  ORF Transcript_100979/g.324201 Transcript_100979/m.324201 type:complete len:257 (+) Transcript_100979:1052-1822(+)